MKFSPTAPAAKSFVGAVVKPPGNIVLTNSGEVFCRGAMFSSLARGKQRVVLVQHSLMCSQIAHRSHDSLWSWQRHRKAQHSINQVLLLRNCGFACGLETCLVGWLASMLPSQECVIIQQLSTRLQELLTLRWAKLNFYLIWVKNICLGRSLIDMISRRASRCNDCRREHLWERWKYIFSITLGHSSRFNRIKIFSPIKAHNLTQIWQVTGRLNTKRVQQICVHCFRKHDQQENETGDQHLHGIWQVVEALCKLTVALATSEMKCLIEARVLAARICCLST